MIHASKYIEHYYMDGKYCYVSALKNIEDWMKTFELWYVIFYRVSLPVWTVSFAGGKSPEQLAKQEKDGKPNQPDPVIDANSSSEHCTEFPGARVKEKVNMFRNILHIAFGSWSNSTYSNPQVHIDFIQLFYLTPCPMCHFISKFSHCESLLIVI